MKLLPSHLDFLPSSCSSPINSMSRFITCKSTSMLLTLSSCPSNEHTSNSLSLLTLLTFIKESCTWSNLRLRCSASVIDLTPGRSSPMPDAWCVTGSVVTRSSSFSSLSKMSETQFTCSYDFCKLKIINQNAVTGSLQSGSKDQRSRPDWFSCLLTGYYHSAFCS